MTSSARHQGKPLLRLLELYVLWSIGRLSAADEATLQAMTPKLQALYGVNGTWQEVIAAAVQLPPTLPDAVRALWAKNTEIARTAGVTLEPQQFAEQVVDRNLVG